MKVLVNAPFQVNGQLQEAIDEKVGKLKTYFDRIVEAEIFLKVGENRHRHREQIVEIRLNVPGTTLFAEDRNHRIDSGHGSSYHSVKSGNASQSRHLHSL